MISIADAAQKSKVLHYADLMTTLDMSSVRELEDLIIDCIYNELLSGQLDQLHQQFHVVSCYGRDLRPSEVPLALAKLEAWDRQLQEAQVFIETQVVQGCNQNVKDNYERQVREQAEVEKRRKEVLEDITNPKLGKQKSRGGEGASGMGGIGQMFSGLARGFLNK